MMKIRLFILLILTANVSFAGTAGNSDVYIIYSFFMAILLIMIMIDITRRIIKRRKARLEALKAQESENLI